MSLRRQDPPSPAAPPGGGRTRGRWCGTQAPRPTTRAELALLAAIALLCVSAWPGTDQQGLRGPLTGTLLRAAHGAAPPSDGAAGLTHRVTRGPVTATVTVKPASVPIGDDVVLELAVAAAPGVELLLPEFGQSLARFAILDFVPGSAVAADGGSLATQRYRLQPLRSGTHVLPPLMVEFIDRRAGMQTAPEGEDAYELLTERVEFEVTSVVPDSAEAALAPPAGQLGDDPAVTARQHLTALGIAAALILALVVWLVRARARRAPSHPDAYALAKGRLASLEARPPPATAAAMDSFFVELSDIVRHYLEDRFHVHAPELTTEEFLDVAARSPDLSADHRQFLGQFLASADRVKFARFVPTAADAEAALAAVASFLDDTRPAGAANRSDARTGAAGASAHA